MTKTKSKLKKTILLCLIGFCVLFFKQSPVISEEKYSQKEGVSKSPTNNTIDHTLINVGNISMWVWADGSMAINPDDEAGAIYPRGTASIIFQDGIIWGGLVRDGVEPLIRIGGQEYRIGTQPGRIISKGMAENPTDPNVNRVWRIRKDLSQYLLEQEVAERQGKSPLEVTYEEVNALRNQYIRNWREWPWQKGAPFYDADDDGVYTPHIDDYGNYRDFPEVDEPGIANADQVVWFVCNDLDTALANNFMGSPPIGLEAQVTLWGYRRYYHALDNCIYKQIRFIYKGTNSTSNDARIDSMYLAQWSDPDLGYAGDDLVGCDTLLNLGYCYNSSNLDPEFKKYRLTPPAAGYNILAGPIVPNSYSEAIFGLQRIPNFRNLRMSAFIHFPYSMDLPDCGRIYSATLQWWNILRGFRHAPLSPIEPFYNPFTRIPTKFRVSGDPVTGVGWLDQYPGDRRMILSSGPFNMSLGDTNEITIALVAGLGGDRLLSLSVMKYYDRIAQATFNNLFEIPQPPPAPLVSISEMDGQIILNWSTSQGQVAAIEQWQDKGYRFEGYNVYQLPAQYSYPKSEWLKLATYDLKNEVASIIQEEFDDESGAILTRAVQIGTNSGIVRSQSINRDEINNHPLINGQEYYFAVTAYSFNPDPENPIKSMESAATTVTVIPQSLKLGERFQAIVGDTIFAEHTAGSSDGKVFAIVIDPTQLTGDNYRVEFYQDGSGKLLWRLVNVSSGETLLRDQTNQSDDENYLIAEGFQLKVIDAPQDFKDFQTIANKNGRLDPPEGAAADWQGFPGSGRPTDAQQVGPAKWLIHTGESISHNRSSYQNFRERVTGNYQNWDMIIPYDYEARFTSRDSKALIYWGFEVEKILITVPFELWNIGINTPDDRSDDYRLFPLLLDIDQNRDFNLLKQADLELLRNGDVADHSVSDGNDDPYTDWFYWSIPKDKSPGETGYNLLVSTIESNPGSFDLNKYTQAEGIRRMVFVNWDGGDVNTGSYNQAMPEEGTIFRIITIKPNVDSDIFNFSTADYRITFDTDLSKQDAATINVYPNPYYGIINDISSASEQFVTFSHLPCRAVIRIFTLAGVLVKTIVKDDQSQFVRWYLNNEKGRLVGNGIYIVHIRLPELGVNKILKLVVVHK